MRARSKIFISIHALRGEGDTNGKDSNTDEEKFQSTPSVGRATPSLVKSVIIVLFQSTPSVGRATALPDPPKKSIEISIHALRGEGDAAFQICNYCNTKISIHALRGEGDDVPQRKSELTAEISIHALRGEGDHFFLDISIIETRFQSTPSVGRATDTAGEKPVDKVISIHALRGEGDFHPMPTPTKDKYFNPRPPWGGRHYIIRKLTPLECISIHALRGEGDC